MENDDGKNIINPSNILFILRRITDDDCLLLGFNSAYTHPRNMIITTVPVSPPQVRPSIVMDTALRSQDDLTHKLSEIIRSNQNLKKHMENNASENTINEFTNLLQFHVTTLIDNEIPGQPQATQRTGRPVKGIAQRLKAKQGRIRGNLMGKRVNFSARTVITAEPNIDLDELGVPLDIAHNMTVPETVTQFNRHILQEYVNNGPEIKDVNVVGAKYIIDPNGSKKDLRFVKNATLNIGDTVERTMKHGDVVVFNRQPTLHKMSMMAHKVRVMEHKTFRLNLSATTPYNADFDGDEMNLHLPQSLAAKAELKELMMVSKNIVSAQSNKPVIGIVQDALLASWKFTGKDVFLTKAQITNIFFNSKERIFNLKLPPPCILKPRPLWSGKQLFNLLFPKDFVFNRMSSWHKPDDEKDFTNDDSEVIVRGGEIMTGQLCKKSLGSSEGGIIHRLWLEYSSTYANNFISNLQFMVNFFIQKHGFSIGAGDAFIDKNTKSNVRQAIDDSITKVHQILHVSKNASNGELFEKKVNQLLNNAMAQSGKYVQDKITTKNNIHATVTAGSKGSVLNLSQIMACVGQQNVNGKRIEEGYIGRPLPHFKKYDKSPEAKGFVKHSYLDGLEAHEFFYHAMGGREGVIDTAVKSVTGDTELILIEDKIIKHTSIGDFIDDKLKKYKKDIKYYDEKDANMELIDISKYHDVYIPSTTNDGHMSWNKITNVTRHDPSEMLYTIKTKGGRSVTVVESKSLLVWDEDVGMFNPTDTLNVKVGDFVPVSFNLKNSVVHSTHISTKDYLPKTEYIHGTDFNEAKMYIHSEQKTYDELNNNRFTLPYTQINKLKRCMIRSAIENIKTGYVYPYAASRVVSVPDRFELNTCNGFFFGIYVAEGHSHIKSGKVAITNNDPLIIKKVAEWFDSHGIVHKTFQKKNARYTSTSIQGSSTLLARLMHKLFGNNSRTKFIPPIFQTAPNDFIVAFLDGYYSGDGYVSRNSIECSSASEDVIKGVSMLLSRFGIYSKMSVSYIKKNNFGTKNIAPVNRLSIRSCFALIFANTISLTIVNKQNRLNEIKHSKTIKKHENIYICKNDTILDEIISIEIHKSGDNQKVYDFTVPSTKNFGLYNGLQVYDTSDTGYIQRRLVKSMEDLMIMNDGSVRNSSKDIVQFVYGDDKYDGSMLITQKIYNKDNISKKASKNEIKQLNSIKTKFNSCKSPLLIDILCEKYKKFVHTKLKHAEVFQLVDSCVKYIKPTSKLIEYQIYTGLSSKRVVDECNILKEDLLFIIDEIKRQHYKATVIKGDMLGIIAAQSMGEVVTQLCLNTFHSAGISAKNVTLGVPRFKELINVAKSIKSPSMTLVLKDEYTELDNIDFIAQKLEYVNIDNLVSRKYLSNTRKEFTEKYLSFGNTIEYYDKSIVLHFNFEALKRAGKTLFDVYKSINEHYDETVIPIYNHENDEPIMEILVETSDNEIDDRHVFVLMKKILYKITLDGHEDIKKVYTRRDEDTNKWIIETDGLNIPYIYELNYFENDKAITNHVVDVYEKFGIEAARNVLINEIRHVIEFDGSYINRRHFYILIDTMTHKGDIMPITRHGINKANTGPLMKCSFEETMDILTDAGIYGTRDNLNGVTENIIMGKMAPIGTGANDVYYDDGTSDIEYDSDTCDNYVDDCEGFDPRSEIDTCDQYTDTYWSETTDTTETDF
jgi:DNA-directed RNA polymerase beta' subunit